ncbi:MAG: hypothetical protein AAF821_08255 [Cyanobacteria bacterium P01_D01_bin.156]
MNGSSEIIAAQNLTNQVASRLEQAPAFQSLPPEQQLTLKRDLDSIQQALQQSPEPAAVDPYAFGLTAQPTLQAKPSPPASDPYAMAMETPNDLARRRGLARQRLGTQQPINKENSEIAPTQPKKTATEKIATAAGAVLDELDFSTFVANLVHGTFDAIVESSIRQMEAFAGLVSAVAKDVNQFTDENVTPNQVRDWLVELYPRDLQLDFSGGQPRLRPMHTVNEDGDDVSPSWLADYGLADEDFTQTLIEEQLIPAARRKYGSNRLQTLATMVLMGMNRIVVRDGSISAKLKFRAAARDKAAVEYAVSQDPGTATGSNSWGMRGRNPYQSIMKVSTVEANVQSDAVIKADLYGEVKINFASETLPLESFADAAQLALLQSNARTLSTSSPPANSPPANSQQTPSPPATALPAPSSAVPSPSAESGGS